VRNISHITIAISLATLSKQIVIEAAEEKSLFLVLVAIIAILPNILDLKIVAPLKMEIPKPAIVLPNKEKPNHQPNIQKTLEKILDDTIENIDQVYKYGGRKIVEFPIFYIKHKPIPYKLDIGPNTVTVTHPTGRTTRKTPIPIEEGGTIKIIDRQTPIEIREKRQKDGTRKIQVLLLPWNRGATHSLSIPLLLTPLIPLQPLHGSILFAVACLHPITDMLSTTGCKLFWPIKKERIPGLGLVTSSHDPKLNGLVITISALLTCINIATHTPMG